jgi:hypothetical protein
MPLRFCLAAPLATLVAGCNLIASSGIQTDYSFDALQYASPEFGDSRSTATVPDSFDALQYASPEFGDSRSTATVPDVSCDPANDVCAMAAQAASLPSTNVTFLCDPALRKCVAHGEVRASEAIDLSKQMESQFPPQAIQFGVEVVEVKRVTYWVDKNSINVATPPIQIYVAPAAARDERDGKATLLASVASLPAKSMTCTDPRYDKGDMKAPAGVAVCSAPLPEPGKAALADFVKDFKTPFQIIAHAIVVAKPGDPVPSGSITFSARPTVGLKILD